MTSADVRRTATGVYCIKNVPRGWRVATVTADNTDNANDTLVSILTNQTGTLNGCNQGDGERMRVRTWDVSDGALADRAFLLVVHD